MTAVGLTDAGAHDNGKTSGEGVTAAQRAFAVFRDDATAGTDSRNSLTSVNHVESERAFASLDLPPQVQIDPTTVRLAQSTGDSRILVMAGSGSICMVHENRVAGAQNHGFVGGGCGYINAAVNPATPQIQFGPVAHGKFMITGLFTDAVTSVTLEMSDGSKYQPEIVNNTVHATFPGTGRTLTWTDRTGKQFTLDVLRAGMQKQSQ